MNCKKASLLLAGFFLILNSSFAQIVTPGGGVYAISDVPGLQPALDETLTNAIKGADTGTSSGEVARVGREAVISFPTMPSYLYISTNSIHGTAYIDPSGITAIDFFHTFPNIPFITLTPVGTNIAQLLTPVLITVSSNGATFAVVSSGAIVTNAYRVDWQANDGAGLSWAGTSLAALGGPENVYRNDGSNAMNVFYFPATPGAGTWLAGDVSGYGSWQQRTIANLIDGASVFKKDGTVLPTADFDMNGKQLKNATKVQVTTGAGVGKVLTSDASGYGSWATLAPSRWSTYNAISTVQMAGNAIAGVGALTVNGLATFNSTETHNGTVGFNGTVNASTLNASGTFTTTGRIRANKTGGSYGDPAMQVAGYSRFNGTADFRGLLDAYGLVYARGSLLAWQNPANYRIAIGTADDGSHAVIHGWMLLGDAAWCASRLAGMGTTSGHMIIQGNFACGGTFTAIGEKSFRITHPKDASKWLFHASMESPNVELIYRGKTTLVNGNASVNLNTYYGLIPQTLDAMLTNLTVNVYNNAGWTKVRCKSVNSSVAFDIEAETTACNDTVEWIAIGTRCDAGVAGYKIEANK